MNFIPCNVHPSWNEFLTEEVVQEIHNIEKEIEEKSNMLKDFILLPEEKNILIFLTKDLEKVRKIWQGMDPYPETYMENGKELPVANGRAFWPANAKSWQDPIKQASLRNILRNYYNENYGHEEDWRKIKKFSEIRKEIREGKVQIKEPQEWFQDLENSGVLFLNTSFSLIKYESGKHKSNITLWENFTKRLIKYILEKAPEAKWCIWGTEAKKATEMVPENKKQISAHPSRCMTDKNNFLKNKDLF